MKKLEFTITVVFSFLLKTLALKPAKDIGEGWKFSPRELHGPAGNDGITRFKDAVIRAAALPKEKGYQLLFKTGLAKGQSVITGEDKIKALAAENLADPSLLWSLYNEEGQKTLRYLYDTYGVEWLEGLRRILLDPDGNRFSFYLFRDSDGEWRWDCRWLGRVRRAGVPALVLG